jgi:4-amino-4-deoxy-L-arabinose transferase-like glycosyltransferase
VSAVRNRFFWPVALLLLALLATLQGVAAWHETQNWDEGLHLAAGYSYLKTGDFRMGYEQPPLGKVLCALPLLRLHATLPTDHKSWTDADEITFGDVFMYQNRVPADQMLRAARAVTMLLTLTLALTLAVWARGKFGPVPALLALFLFCLDPNFIAHGHYVTTDLIAALTIFLACLAWGRFLENGRWTALVVAALAVGLAVVSKLSAVFLAPLFVLLYLLRAWQERAVGPVRLGLVRFLASVLVLAVVSLAVIGVTYWPATRRMLRGRVETRLAAIASPNAESTVLLGKAAARLNLPAHPFLIGLNNFLEHSENGHHAYLLGQLSDTGWWYYFPVVFAVKTPTAVLWLIAVSVIAGVLAWWRLPWRPTFTWLRRLPFAWVLVTVPPAVYFALSLHSHINIGVRHILPVYPFLLIFLAAFLCEQARRSRVVLAALLLALPIQAVETARIHPHYLAFFNTLSGGPTQGHRYLLDSNLDWGTDMKYLKTYLQAIHADKVCFCYFGHAAAWYYGVNMQPLPTTEEREAREKLDCVAAVSATPLYGLYVPENDYRWLRDRKPDTIIGHSIYVWDLRKSRPGP